MLYCVSQYVLSHITAVPETVTTDSYFPMERSWSYQTLDIIFTV